MKSYSVEAIVLRMRALGEADRIVTFFSRERGKQNAVARGARKTQSKFGARLDFFSRVALMFHTGKSLDVITSVQTVSSIWEKLVEPDTYAAASYVAETIDALCEPDLAVPELYEALSAFQSALAKGVERDALLAAMDLRILDALGFAPELDACARCGAVLGRRPLKGGRAHLSPQACGLLCDKCRRELRADPQAAAASGGLLSLSGPDFERLRALRNTALEEIAPAQKVAGQLHRVTQVFVEYQMGRRSKALAVVGAGSKLQRSTARKP
ncbi:MAG: DNA repair protein RecO [Candidatus Eremiobacteraeota bacterium]|nr:DNA repair protein RecO [Candidatus Eremiobacteraeota bacterium]